ARAGADAGAGQAAQDARDAARRLFASGGRGEAGDARGSVAAKGEGGDAAGSGAVAGRARQPADGPRGGQLGLAQTLRPRPGADSGGLRPAGREAVAPGVARLAGRLVRRSRLVAQGSAPTDPDERDVSPVFGGPGGSAQTRSV